ncbi:sugar transferase [Polaribacter sp. IC073]|uniref:sugar transferase n=1 Tax=Polaribacter sp. IC073 TaxID=2508540 RepID=UPI0011BFA987|nr:sugar transferase [Polaribacter sp. IC073]TXD48918.1 sugar transferase [Polaribacter sp. IC073]
MYSLFIKRILDITLSLVTLSLVLPIIIITYVILRRQNKGNALFFQERPGYKKKKFSIIKFKTMTDEKDKDGALLPDYKRITKIGNIIRKASIDELPQLINVLKGDMSLIGPRPLLFKYIPLYSDEQLKRHEVLPGITGWAQVNGRNSISWTQKFKLDVYYINHVSFMLDMKILWMTLMKVIKKEGVNQKEERPMLPFDGSN